MSNNDIKFIHWFRSASPYIRVHKGKTFVIHMDDSVIKSENFTGLVHDLTLLNSLEIRLVLVFSTRHSIESRLNDHASQYHDGIRITDGETMEVIKDAAGKLRVEIESALSVGLGNTPMLNAKVIISSGNFVRAKPMGVVGGVDYLYSGMVRSIETETINRHLDANEIVLLPPLGYSITGDVFNLKATALARDVASELGADKIIYLSSADGISDQSGNVIREMIVSEAEKCLLENKIADEAKQQLLSHAVYACNKGVERVHIINSSLDGGLIQELFSRDGIGTMVSRTSFDELRQATVDDISGILELIVPLEKSGVLVERSREKLELEIDNFTVMLRDEVIIGCGALYEYEKEKTAEVACLVIHDEYNKSGRGQQIYSVLEQRAKENDIDSVFVLTTQAEHWFRELGFEEISVDKLPVEKKGLYNFKRNSKIFIKNPG
ncbi:MAG: amino-acid N-acetyltransferase [Gammaproteobacteria bacterium]|nr:amino-acid N-acetyltransferase [Gammaproteobacteria bacterium]